ncbi:MAG: hypothetical protein ABR953_09790 [Candidatus Acidiferrales bacterium]|jgi:hypothetical protein
MKSYWVVSPNIASELKGALDKWKQIIFKKHVAIMGWGPDKEIGRRFVREIAPEDLVLIARRHKGEPELVGFGVVRGPAELGTVEGKTVSAMGWRNRN